MTPVNNTTYKYFAFISYNSKDAEWGKRLQRKLEHYRMPATLCSERGWERTPINPVFFAPTDIQPGPLSEELQARLRASRNLIVICSPNSAQSEWVGREIAFFHSMGRSKNIHFFIVDGVPHSGDIATECFHPVVQEIGLKEILGANINEKFSRLPQINRERAYVQLISKLLNVEFDTIWQRHKRLMIQKAIMVCIGIAIVLAAIWGVWAVSRSVDVELSLKEVSVANTHLPPLEDAVVTLTLDNEIKTDTIHSLNTYAVFTNIPHRFIGKRAHIAIRCEDYIDVDTTLLLSEKVAINIERDPKEYGNIVFDIWDDTSRGVAGVEVTIADKKAVSDSNGHIHILVPLKEQQTRYHITASVPLGKDTIYMPCGEDNVVVIK